MSDQVKVAFMVSHLTGRADAWATAEWSTDSNICQSLTLFRETMSRIFDHSLPAGEASRALMQLKQRHRQVVDYAIEFCTVAADSGWNSLALIEKAREKAAKLTALRRELASGFASSYPPRTLTQVVLSFNTQNLTRGVN